MGTANIKKALCRLFELAEKLEIALKDGKVSFNEGVGMIPQLGGFVLSIVQFRFILEEVRDLDREDLNELAGWAKEKFNLQNDKLEEIIESLIDLGVKVEESLGMVKKSVGGGGPSGEPDGGGG